MQTWWYIYKTIRIKVLAPYNYGKLEVFTVTIIKIQVFWYDSL
jgi:hypothetical protein